MDTVDYSPYNIPNPDPAKTYAIKYPALVQATQDTDNALIAEINTAKGSSTNLSNRLVDMDTHINANSTEINTAKGSFAQLSLRLDDMDTHINANSTEINTARGSFTQLSLRLEDMDTNTRSNTTEMTIARQGQANLNARLNQLLDPHIGLNHDLAANGQKITDAADAVNGQDLTTLSQVNALLSTGGNPVDINILGLGSSSMDNGEWIYKAAGSLQGIDSNGARSAMDVPSNSEINQLVASINSSIQALRPTVANTLLYS